MLHYLIISFILLLIGICGLYIVPKNLILILISLEIILLAINYNFLIFSALLNDLSGQLYALIILVIAAVESSIGLAFLVLYYRLNNTIIIDHINQLKG